MQSIRIIGLAGALCAFAVTAHAQVGGAASRGALASGTVAIVNVNVVPMTSETVVRDVTVIVRDGRIASIAPSASVRVPQGAHVIDARGKYLIPGLADMHTHLYSDGDVPDSAAPAELGVMLANGITAIRLMGGTPEQLQLRQQVISGDVVGPQLWVSSPYFSNKAAENTRVVTSAAEARTAVRDVVRQGYDFIKVAFGITGDVYDALVDEAKRANIGVVGHVEPEVGVRRALAAGQQIEHLDAYFEAALADDAPMKTSLTQYGIYRPANWASLDYIDDRKLTEIAQATARANVWTGPTLEIFNRAFGDPLSDDELMALPDWNMIPAAIRGPYMNSRKRYWAQPVPLDKRKRFAEIRSTLVKRISDAGGKILAGSDSPDLLMAYGFAMHRELQALVHAGLTPYQALAAATRNPAEFLGAQKEFGTIEAGKRADLVLLAENPLSDIRNTQRIESVVMGGRYLEKQQLGAMITAGARAIGGIEYESAIKAELDTMLVAWNRDDLDKHIDVYADDATWMTARGLLHGKAAIRESLVKGFQRGSDLLGELSFSDLELRQVGPNAVMSTGGFKLTSLPSGKDIVGRSTLMWVRIGNRWRIIHDHSS